MENKIDNKTLLAYCAINGYLPYVGSPRKRDSLPQEEQEKKIKLAKDKRARKALKKILQGLK